MKRSFTNLNHDVSALKLLYYYYYYYYYFGFETGLTCSFGACPGTSYYRPGWLSKRHRDLPASAS